MNSLYQSAFLLILLSFLSFHAFGSDKLGQDDLRKLSKAYGYYHGQTTTLGQIAKQHPSLKLSVTQARLEFDATFKFSVAAITEVLASTLTNVWDDVKADMEDKIEAELTSQRYSEEQSTRFIAAVRARATGKIDPPILETLLLYQPAYRDSPHIEFTDGYKKVYESDGSGKAKGLAFSIEAPITWEAREASRPNIVQKFVSGHNSEATFSVIVKNLEDAAEISEAEVKEYIADGNVKDFIMPDAENIQYGYIALEGAPGFWASYKASMVRVRHSMELESIMYVIFHHLGR
jgi:hypothetical protein